MRLIEDHELDAVTGALSQQEMVDVIERVLREMQRPPVSEPIVW